MKRKRRKQACRSDSAPRYPKHNAEAFRTFRRKFAALKDEGELPPIKITKDCYPRKDPVFTAIMQDIVLLEELLSTLTGKPVKLDPDSITEQKEFDVVKVDGKRVRVDTFAKGVDGCVYSVDMQTTYAGGRECLVKRSWYYAARAFSSQPVSDMHYEELKACTVVFMLPSITPPDESGSDEDDQMKGGVYEYFVCRKDPDGTTAKLDGLMNTYEVYSPEFTGDEKIKIFSDFFKIRNGDEAAEYSVTYASNSTARRLIRNYAVVSADEHLLRLLEKEEHFMSKSDLERRLQDLKAEREAGRKEGRKEGREEGVEKGRTETIYTHIESLRRIGIDESIIGSTLSTDFKLSNENVDKFMRGLIPYPDQAGNTSMDRV